MRVVVLGDGLLGNEITKQTRWDSISRKKDNIDAVLTSWFNMLDKYDTVVNCIAYTKTYTSDKSSNWDINVLFVDKLIDYCNINSKKLIHISTDYIYSFSNPQASEEDIPVHLKTWYGYTKLIGDAMVQARSKNYLLCRLSHKPYPFPYENAWDNQLTNGDYVTTIANLVIKLITLNQSGVFNVGTDLKTWYDLTKDEFKTSPVPAPEVAPLDISMNTNKLKHVIETINK